MKAIKIVTLFMLTASVCLQTKASYDVSIPVVLVEQPERTNRPKAPVRIPIECYYDSAENCIVASEKYDCGIVSVVISNDNTGYTTSGILSYTDEPLKIWLPGTGNYTLTFVTTTGHTYTGTIPL